MEGLGRLVGCIGQYLVAGRIPEFQAIECSGRSIVEEYITGSAGHQGRVIRGKISTRVNADNEGMEINNMGGDKTTSVIVPLWQVENCGFISHPLVLVSPFS